MVLHDEGVPAFSFHHHHGSNICSFEVVFNQHNICWMNCHVMRHYTVFQGAQWVTYELVTDSLTFPLAPSSGRNSICPVLWLKKKPDDLLISILPVKHQHISHCMNMLACWHQHLAESTTVSQYLLACGSTMLFTCKVINTQAPVGSLPLLYFTV